MAQLKSSWDRRSIGPIHPSAGTSGTNTCSTRNPRKRTSRMPKKWHRRQKMIRHFGSFWLEQVWNHSPLAANYRLAAGSLPGVRHMLSVPVPQEDGEGISVAAIGKLHSEAPAVQKCSNAQPQMIKWCGPKNWNITLITQCAPTLEMCIYTITFNSIYPYAPCMQYLPTFALKINQFCRWKYTIHGAYGIDMYSKNIYRIFQPRFSRGPPPSFTAEPRAVLQRGLDGGAGWGIPRPGPTAKQEDQRWQGIIPGCFKLIGALEHGFYGDLIVI